jgi:hypothetical protein
MRTTVNLPDPLLKNARRFAEQRGMTISTLIEDSLRIRMAERKQVKTKHFRLYTVKGRLVDPNINLDKTSELIMADDEAWYKRRR